MNFSFPFFGRRKIPNARYILRIPMERKRNRLVCGEKEKNQQIFTESPFVLVLQRLTWVDGLPNTKRRSATSSAKPNRLYESVLRIYKHLFIYTYNIQVDGRDLLLYYQINLFFGLLLVLNLFRFENYFTTPSVE